MREECEALNVRIEEDTVESSCRRRASVLDWVLFVPFAVAFLATLFLFEILERVSFATGGRRRLERVIRRLNRMLLFDLRFIGARVSVEGRSPVPVGTPCIIVANHQTMYDIPLLGMVFEEHFPRFVAKRALSRWLPGISFNLRAGGSAIIDRENAAQALKAIARLGKLMEAEAFGVVLFPEGTRAREGELKRFRPSGFAALLRSSPSAVIVPAALDNSWKLLISRYGPLRHGTHLRVRVGPLLRRNDFAAPEELLDQCHHFIEGTLREWRMQPETFS